MCASKQVLIISLVFATSINATSQGSWSDGLGSKSQGSWFGGPGVYGPVTTWSDDFFYSSCVDYSYPYFLYLEADQSFTVDGYYHWAASVYSEDIDGDGDMDVLGAASADQPGADDITWWENVDGSGSSWVENTIDGNFTGAIDVYSEDIDGDGDMDVIGAGYFENQIAWWENVDGLGTSWTKYIVDGNFIYAYSVYSEDIDGDGDMDILGTSWWDDDITWWENTDGSGTSWTEHTIDGNVLGAASVYSADIDNDGHMDVLGAASIDAEIIWWENMDGSGTSWTEHNIAGSFVGAHSVYSEDIDGDGDLDVLGAASFDDEFAWWENVDGSGTTWTEHIVAVGFDGPFSVYSEDLDGDNDMDILGAAFNSSDVVWWENEDGFGTSWIEHVVDDTYNAARSVYAEDVDGDGNPDVLAAAFAGHLITWWRLTEGYMPSGYLESSILDLAVDPDWDNITWGSETPAGTAITFQVRASDDYLNMGDWSEVLTSPCSLEGILNDGDSYVQYRTNLESADPDSTPVLNIVTIFWDVTGFEEEPQPTEYILYGTSTNPVRGAVIISFAVPQFSFVKLSVFDLSGRLVSEICGEDYSPGMHDVQFGDISPGIYLCRMISGDFIATQRFVVIE